MKNPMTVIAQLKKQRDEKPKQYVIPYGEQDLIDIISYGGLEEQKDYLIIDGQYVRTLFVSGYPFTAQLGWMDGLINFHHNADITQQIERVDPGDAVAVLSRKITELESQKSAKISAGSEVPPKIENPLNSAKLLREGIISGQEKLFQVGIYIGLSAPTLEELNGTTKILAATLSARLFYTKVATFQQIEGLQSILPRGEDLLAQKRNLNSSTAALAFPLMSSEKFDETGFLYGINQDSNTLVILDRFKLNNANSITFAQSGAGKSYAAKVEIARSLSQGTDAIIIDPEREYENLTRSYGGTYIRLSAQSEQKINPFDFGTTGRNKEQKSEHIQDLTEVISLMVGGLNDQEQAGVDKAILKIYERTDDRPPLLADFYDALHHSGHHKLCERLEKYTTGSLTDILDSHTNIDLTNRLVVFDIKDLSESLRPIMMMIIANFVQNEVKLKPKKRLLVIDEGWLLLEHEQSARFVSGLVRRARKYYLGVAIISQQATDFLESKYGRAIASQSSLRFLMKQDTTTIESIAREFRLSAFEKNYLLTCDRGDALIIADQDHVAVHIVASPEEHPLITTDPVEAHQA